MSIFGSCEIKFIEGGDVTKPASDSRRADLVVHICTEKWDDDISRSIERRFGFRPKIAFRQMDHILGTVGFVEVGHGTHIGNMIARSDEGLDSLALEKCLNIVFQFASQNNYRLHVPFFELEPFQETIEEMCNKYQTSIFVYK